MLKNQVIYEGNDIEYFKDILRMLKTQKVVVKKEDFGLLTDTDNELMISVWNKLYPVRETALTSLLSRYRIGGDAFRHIDDATIKQILDLVQSQFPKAVSVMISNEAVNAVNSENYVHLPMIDVIEHTEDFIIPMCSNGQPKTFIESDFNQTKINFYTDKKFKFNDDEKNLVITLLNSENGDASLRYSASLATSHYLIPIMSDMFIVHKGNATMDNVDEKLSQLEAVATKNVEAVVLLESINVTKPLAAVNDFGSQAGLPKKVIKDFERKLNALGYDHLKASDIYEMLVCIVNDNVMNDYYKNDLIKLLRMDWEKYGEKVDANVVNTHAASKIQKATPTQFKAVINSQLTLF